MGQAAPCVHVAWSWPPLQLHPANRLQGLTQRTIRQRRRAVEEPPQFV